MAAQLFEIDTVDVVKNKKEVAVRHAAKPVHRHDARMTQPGHDGGFLHEVLDQMAPVSESLAQDLDCHACAARTMARCIDF